MVQLRNHRPNPCNSPLNRANRARNRGLSSVIRVVSKDKNPDRVRTVCHKFDRSCDKVNEIKKAHVQMRSALLDVGEALIGSIKEAYRSSEEEHYVQS